LALAGWLSSRTPSHNAARISETWSRPPMCSVDPSCPFVAIVTLAGFAGLIAGTFGAVSTQSPSYVTVSIVMPVFVHCARVEV